MSKINPTRLWNWILQKQDPPKSEAKLLLLKESFDHKQWDGKVKIWSQSKQAQHLKAEIKSAYFHYKTGTLNFSDPVQYMDKDNSKGFVIFLSRLAADYTLNDYRCLQHLLTQKLVDHRYIVKLSDIRSARIHNQLQLTYRYYQKPSMRIQTTAPMNQLFGNITSEIILRDDQPYLFRVMAHKYSDRNYRDAGNLNQMMEVLLD